MSGSRKTPAVSSARIVILLASSCALGFGVGAFAPPTYGLVGSGEGERSGGVSFLLPPHSSSHASPLLPRRPGFFSPRHSRRRDVSAALFKELFRKIGGGNKGESESGGNDDEKSDGGGVVGGDEFPKEERHKEDDSAAASAPLKAEATSATESAERSSPPPTPPDVEDLLPSPDVEVSPPPPATETFATEPIVASTSPPPPQEEKEEEDPTPTPPPPAKKASEATPFFASSPLGDLKEKSVEAAQAPAAVESEKKVEPKEEEKPREEESALSAAKRLRAQAARIRLEAEKRRVELTLDKIGRVGSELEKLKKRQADGNGAADGKEEKRLEEQLGMLRAQLVIEEVTTPAKKGGEAALSSRADTSKDQSAEADATIATATPSAEELAERARAYAESPEFIKILVAKLVGFGVDESTPGAVDSLNATAITAKLIADGADYAKVVGPSFTDDEIERAAVQLKELSEEERNNVYGESTSDEECVRMLLEASYLVGAGGGDAMPTFTEEQIQDKIDELKIVPKFLRDFNADNGFDDKEMARLLLEEQWLDDREKEVKKEERGKDGGFFGGFFDGPKGEGTNPERPITSSINTYKKVLEFANSTAEPLPDEMSLMMQSSFPESTRKEGAGPSLLQVKSLLSEVVVPTKAFAPSGDPIAVPGGYIVRGSRGGDCKSGEELIERIDKRLATDARLREKITVFYLKDPFPNPEDAPDPFDWPTVLFVSGPDVARDTQPIARAAVSSVAIATAWYSSIYPFLVNTKLMDRANESMDLTDAGMASDMGWLTDLSVPMLLAFVALQATHEIAHAAVAKSRGFETHVPTIIPSFVSGITNSITSLKSPPKNKQDLLDFALAGPLAGMTCSILVLCYGLVATANADAASYQFFPAMPLAILRQSSLGGGLIDIFLGNGVLDVPSSAEGLRAVEDLLIPLHPLAVAGFFSLMVNALSLIPVGRTDGGRVSMALFGRSGTQAVTLVSFFAMFVLGLTGESDLLLFYFAFAVFFQIELEIPSRNEVDDVDFSRVILASFAGFLMLLTLIPMS